MSSKSTSSGTFMLEPIAIPREVLIAVTKQVRNPKNRHEGVAARFIAKTPNKIKHDGQRQAGI